MLHTMGGKLTNHNSPFTAEYPRNAPQFIVRPILKSIIKRYMYSELLLRKK